MTFMPDIIEIKKCPDCERELVRYINFSLKGRLCRDCTRLRNEVEKRKQNRDPRLRWNRIVLAHKRAN